MEISTFELIYKTQSPAGPNGADPEDVIQGYFLAISNLEKRAFSFALDFVAQTDGVPANRTLEGTTLFIVDRPVQDDNQFGTLVRQGTSRAFRPSTGFVEIPAESTALVAVLPRAFNNRQFPQLPKTFEARGFVRIRVPALFKSLKQGFVAQSTRKVAVLLTPQHRATFLTATNVVSDQIQATLPTGPGGARYELEPEKSRPAFANTFETAGVVTGGLGALVSMMTPEELSQLAMAAIASARPDVDLNAMRDRLAKELDKEERGTAA